MGKNGGKRPGAGRKPKIAELDLVEAMDAYMEPYEWSERLYNVIKKGKERDQLQGLKLWAEYRFGRPKQQVDVTTNGKDFQGISPIEWAKSE